MSPLLTAFRLTTYAGAPQNSSNRWTLKRAVPMLVLANHDDSDKMRSITVCETARLPTHVLAHADRTRALRVRRSSATR